MKKGLLLFGGVISLLALASCNEETKIEYIDRVVEIEKPIEVIKEVEVVKEVEVEKTVYVEKPIEIEKIVEKEVKVEVPVEKIVEVEKVIEKEIPIEVEKIVNNYIEVEVPIEKIVEVERIVEVEKIVEKEIYNSYFEDLQEAFDNCLYCDDSNYKQIYTVGNTIPYLAVYVQGISGSKNSVVGYHSLGATESFMHMYGTDLCSVNYTDTHNQLVCIKKESTIDYTDFLNKPFATGWSYYHGENHLEEYYGPSESYKHTLGDNKLGLHILKNVRVEEKDGKNNMIDYNGINVVRLVLSYEEDYWIGEPFGIIEEMRTKTRKLNEIDLSNFSKEQYYTVKQQIGSINPKYYYEYFLKK